MPRFRKLSPATTATTPPTLSARSQIALAYDVLLIDFAISGPRPRRADRRRAV